MKIAQPETEQDFIDYYDFRWEQLRKQWNQPRGSERDHLEESSHHFFAKDEAGVVLGVGRVHMNSSAEAQIRHMAVRPDSQGQGIGRQIVEWLEQVAISLGASHVVLNARENALGFYERLGYVVVSDGQKLFGEIAHLVMRKELAAKEA